ncbi:MAG TPA: beta-propeller domain-containing protein [Clostridiaceae bacterium]
MDNNEKIKLLKEEYESKEPPKELDFAIETAIKRGRKYKSNIKKKWAGLVAAASIIFICTLSLSGSIPGSSKKATLTTNKSVVMDVASTSSLPVVGTKGNLTSLLAKVQGQGSMQDGGIEDSKSMSIAPKTTQSTNTVDSNLNKNYSQTNLQVKGVDEGDIVKTDGAYIYELSNSKLQIVTATPTSMAIVKEVKYSDDFQPTELYLKDNKLIVIGTNQIPFVNSDKAKQNVDSKNFPKTVLGTKAIIYDIEDKSNIKNIKEVEIGGNYTSSRLIDNELYMVANQNNNFYYPIIAKKDYSPDNVRILSVQPVYKDNSKDKTYKLLDYDKIYYMPNDIEANYINTASINLNNISEEVKISATLGYGNNVYVDDKNMYIAGNSYNSSKEGSYTVKTKIYKFSLGKGNVTSVGIGEVPGTILNQFSMDEYDNYFRIATTQVTVGDLTNNVYILDDKLNLVGSVTKIANGEKIYSTRFIGNKLYMVTFKNTDPLFVVDLANVREPKILGELKIPGFSNYLEPYDENHIIGFGKDAEDQTIISQNTITQSSDGNSAAGNPVDSTISMSKGFKMALFDISDVTKPILEFSVSLGDHGTYSEILNNHKALLFSKEKNIIAFPITIMETKDNYSSKEVFQGAYVYSLDLNKGFNLRGTITHKADGIKDYSADIQRILYIKDDLYTLSNSYIKANSIMDLTEVGKVKIN